MEVVTIESAAFKELIKNINEIKFSLSEKTRKTPLSEIWLDISETCMLLKISKRTLQTYRDNGILSYSQISGKIYFKASDIEVHLQRNYISK
jgi:predicted site-specific integrase-resolvase